MVKEATRGKQVMKNALIRRTITINVLIQENQHIMQEQLGQTRSRSKDQGVQQKNIKKIVQQVKNIKRKKPIQKEFCKKKVNTIKNAINKDTLKKTLLKDNKKKQVTQAQKGESKRKKNVIKLKNKFLYNSEKKRVENLDEKEGQKKILDKLQKENEKKGRDQDQAKLPRKTESKASAGIVDVVFCVDTTNSMQFFLDQTKNTIKEIINNIKSKASNEDISVKFGFVCYRDHPPQDYTYVTKIQNLCGVDEIINFINLQEAQGGGDIPEAVLDGLYDAAKMIEWRDASHKPSLRYIFHLADAPPHGKEFTNLPSLWSNGVPSGVTLEKVTHVINIREIHYRLINVSKSNLLEDMKKLFKSKFTNYEETELINAKDLDFRVSDMIIRELLPDLDYDV